MKPRVVCVKPLPLKPLSLKPLSLLGVLGAALFAACAGAAQPQSDLPSDLLSGGETFVEVHKAQADDDAAEIANAMSVLGTAASGLTSGEDNFFLAVNRRALEGQWFLSSYMKQYHLGNAGVAAAATLGTRVVSFKVQNDKLYVFDTSDQFKVSELFDPDVVLEAYPIVHLDAFDRLPGAEDFVLVDPSAGLNRFQVAGDLYADPNLSDRGSLPLDVGLAYMQNFRQISDGVTFEEVFSGQLDLTPFGGELSSAWGTLGVSIRAYQVGEGYVPTADPGVPHFFLSDSRFIPDSFQTLDANPVRWDLHPGREPIQVFITAGAQRAQADFPDVDILGALERGVEDWNDVIGYEAFDAVLVDDDEIRDDDKSTALIDYPGAGNGFAFADWRSNPNNGEILGGSVYFDGAFFTSLPLFEDDDDGGVDLTPADRPAGRPATYSFLWGGMPARRPACQLEAPDKLSHLVDSLRSDTSLTAQEKGANYIQSVMAHEWGHVLGLRHNFKGSLVPPTSSVMEYNVAEATFAQPTPADYDRQAIEYLYGRSTELPTLPFCTDEDTLVDPNCVRFDIPTPTPLYDYQIPDYVAFASFVLEGFFPPSFADLIVQIFGTELYAYARTGTPTEAADAWSAALEGIRPPFDPFATPEGLDAMTAAVFREALVAPTAANTTPFSDPAVVAAIATDGKTALVNAAGALSYPTRRLVVDALKKAQTTPAYVALLEARDALTAQLPGLSPTDQALTRDLLARLNAAVSPYFE